MVEGNDRSNNAAGKGVRRKGNSYHTLYIAGLSVLLISGCGGRASRIRLGNCQLTITVHSEADDFEGFADVYINGQFVGTTDPSTRMLRVNLRKGEYTLIVAAPGHVPWRQRVSLLGADFKQSVLARLKKETLP